MFSRLDQILSMTRE